MISFRVLASEFNAELENINLFDEERHDFFGQKPKGGPLQLKIFNDVPTLNFGRKES